MAYIPGDPYLLLLSAIVTVGYQTFFFIIAFSAQFDKLTDLAGGTNFVVLAIITLALNGLAGTWNWRNIVVSAMVLTWGFRLSGFLFYRIMKIGEDHRFDPGSGSDRTNFWKFGRFWVIQAIWVWTVSLPLTFLNGINDQVDAISGVDGAGIALWALGFVVEVAADQTKFSFKMNPANKGLLCQKGVWHWSRHPNYFGEISLWWGILMICAPVFNANPIGYVGVIGPVVITLLLLFLSGIPMLESRMDERYRGIDWYETYHNRTSILIPMPPALYAVIPSVIKAIFLFEWPFYRGQRKVATDSPTDSHNAAVRVSLVDGQSPPADENV